MIPLVYFLFAWLAFMMIFAFMSLITVFMNLRYGLSGTTTYVTTGTFVAVSCLVFVAAGTYLLFFVDWNASVGLLPSTPSGGFVDFDL